MMNLLFCLLMFYAILPRTDAKHKKRCKHWFDIDCKDTMKVILIKFYKIIIISENLSNFRISQARRACRENKRAS